jgi:hypothetical protein
MSKKSDYAAFAESARQMADEASGAARTHLLRAEAEWRRLAAACFEVSFGDADERRAAAYRFRFTP